MGEPARRNDEGDLDLLGAVEALLERYRGRAGVRSWVVPTPSEGFWLALATLPSHGVAPEAAARALKFWAARASPRHAPEPSIEVVDEAVRFTWSRADLYAHVDVRADGFVWFFQDDRAGVHDGTEHPLDEVPDGFFHRLRDAWDRGRG